MRQSCFLDLEKKNGKSYVRKLRLRTRRSKILLDIKQLLMRLTKENLA